MDIELGNKLINEEKYLEAYKYFYNCDLEKSNIVAKFFMVYIDYNFLKEKNNKEYYEDFKKVLKVEVPFLFEVLTSLIYLGLELSLYIDVKKYCKMAFKYNLNEPFIYYAYAKVIEDNSLKLKYLNSALDSNDATEFVINISIKLKMEILANSDLVAYDNYINKMLLTHKDKDFINYLRLIIELDSNTNINQIKELENLVINKNNKKSDFYYDALYQLGVFYDKKDYFKAESYFKQCIEFSFNKNYGLYDLACFYYQNDKSNETKECLDELINNGFEPDFLYRLYGNLYLKCGLIADKKQAIYYFEKAYFINQKEFLNAKYLLNAYILTFEFEKLLDFINSLEKNPIIPKSFIDYAKSIYYFNTGEFDLALNYETKLNKQKEGSIYRLLVREKSIKKINFLAKKMINKPMGYFDYRTLAKYYFHGEHGFKYNYEKALDNIKKGYEILPNNTCVLSVYGNIILNDNPNDAFSYFNNGADLYYNGSEGCNCCIAFLAKCYYYGIGCTKDINKAKDMVYKEIEKISHEASENLVHLYAYFNLIEDKDLIGTYSFLSSFYERRYSYTRYYLMAILELKLFKKIKDTTSELRNLSFNYIGSLERDYYKKINLDLVFPFMTNN